MPTYEQFWPNPVLKPGVRERCGNMQGPELIRELLRSGLKIAETDDYDSVVSTNLKDLVEYSARYPFPNAPMADSSDGLKIHDPTPVLMVAAFVKNTINTKTKKTKTGNIILDGTVTFDKIGSLFTHLATDSVYPDKDIAHKMVLQTPGSLLKAVYENPHMTDILRIVSSSIEMTKISFLMQNLVPDGLSKVRVGASIVHGNGVFAEHQINAGDVITMYPCDIIALDNPGGGMRLYRADGKDLTRTEANVYIAYLCKVQGTRIAIAGDPDKYCPAACAHIINDGAYIDKADFTLDEAVQYTEKSCNTQNCHFVSVADCAMVAIATKVIQKDEEVFAGYGAEFWGHIAKRGNL